MQLRTVLSWMGGFTAAALLLAPRVQAQQLTAAEILNNVAQHNNERLAALQHYSADRTYHFDYNGFGGGHTAELTVHVEYTAPGHKHFTVTAQRGSKAFCDKVLMKIIQGEEEASNSKNQGQTALSTTNYNATLVGQEQLDGIKAWVLDVTPKVPSKYDYRGRIWVSADDFGIMRVLGEPAKEPSWLVNEANFDYRYQRIGMFWLPAQNTSLSHVRLGGDGHLTISYGTYTIDQKQKNVQTAHLSPLN